MKLQYQNETENNYELHQNETFALIILLKYTNKVSYEVHIN